MKSYIKVITTILLFLSTLSLRAQTDSVRGRTTSSLTLASALLDPITLPASLDQDVERLLERWYSGYGQHKGVRGSTRYTPSSVTIPYTPDSVYIRMLNKMPSAMRFSYNPLVREAIELYLFRRRGLLSSMLSLADLYFPEIEVTLDKNALPMELLSVNSLVDERMDPVKSTEAACRFLKDLYRIYGDWWLVLAAYNCGPGNVNRALRRTGIEKPNFWEIYRYLPNETRRYIPLFIGAYFAMHYHREYGIVPRELGRPLATDYYTASHRVTFDRISELTGVDTETISAFNPQFRRGIIPGNNQPYPVRLPLSAIIKLDSLSEEVSSPELRVNLEGPSSSTVGKKSQKESTEGVEEATSTTKTKKRDRASKRDRQSRKAKANSHSTHKVRSGETLYSIAHKYGVSVSELKRANGLKSDRLSVGQSISVHKK